MRFILHRPLPLVCVGSFRLCGTAGSRGGSGPGGTGAGGREGGGVAARDPRAYMYILVKFLCMYLLSCLLDCSCV